MSEPLQGTASAAEAIARVHYTHDAMIDLIIAQPGISQNQIAAHFGYSFTWVSRIFNSDAFQARLALRKSDLVDPSILMSIDERLRVVADRSLEILHEKLEATKNTDLALKIADMSVKALGYGARASNISVQQNFVVALPPKAASESDWASKHAGTLPRPGFASGDVVDVLSTPVPAASPDLVRLAEGA
jgi:AraC-like DNA-binding protein